MAKYRKKPVVIEAFQMTGERRRSNVDWPEWLHLAWQKERGEVGAVSPFVPSTSERCLLVRTPAGEVVVAFDDWIIQGVQGELYPCKDSIFQATYDPVEPDGSECDGS